jgi:hypothetical protein
MVVAVEAVVAEDGGGGDADAGGDSNGEVEAAEGLRDRSSIVYYCGMIHLTCSLLQKINNIETMRTFFFLIQP